MDDVPLIDDREGIEALRAALDGANYTSEALFEALGLEGPFSRDPGALPVYLRMLPDDTAFSALTMLFMLGVGVDVEQAESALAPADTAQLERMGLLAVEDGAVRAKVSIMPWGGFLLVSDPLDEDLPPTRGDHVIGVIPPSVTLASLVPQHRFDAVLDVGSGSGVLSLLASRFAERVVGVDVNPRAVRFAELNALLNGVGNAEFRLGDAFEAVEGESFDLIVSNPPYVISPESHYAFRDSGLAGDAFCERLARGAARHLTEGGIAELLVSWVHGREDDWTAPLRRWLDGSGCDALVFHWMSQDPLAYAALFNRHLRWDAVAHANALDRWLEYDRELGIEAIGWGALVLRRRSGGANWFWARSTSVGALDEAGAHVERMIAAQDDLVDHDGDGLRSQRLVLADDHRLDQTLVLRDRKGTVDRALLRLDGGFNFAVTLSRDAFGLITQLDGRPLGEVLDELVENAEPEARDGFAAEGLELVRELFELGIVVRADGDAR